MFRKLTGILMAAALAITAVSPVFADDIVDYIQPGEDATLSFSFEITREDDSDPSKSDLSINVSETGPVSSYIASSSLNGSTLDVDVKVRADEGMNAQEKRAVIKVSVKPRSTRNGRYHSVDTQSQEIMVRYPDFDLDGLEDTISAIRTYNQSSDSFSSAGDFIPAKAVSMLKEKLKSDAQLTFPYDNYDLVFTGGRNMSGMRASSICAYALDEADSALMNLLKLHKVDTTKVKFLQFANQQTLGGTVGIRYPLVAKEPHVYQFSKTANKLVEIPCESNNGVYFETSYLTQYVITTTPLDAALLTDAESAKLDEQSAQKQVEGIGLRLSQKGSSDDSSSDGGLTLKSK